MNRINVAGCTEKTTHGKRTGRDFYKTPRHAIVALLEREKFKGDIWECACGDGHISNVLEEYGYNVKATDIVTGVDFLKTNTPCENIVTNPPYNQCNDFLDHALQVATGKVAMLLRLKSLETIDRYQRIWSQKKLKKVYQFVRRVQFTQKNGSMMAVAWFIWDQNYSGLPTLDWIVNEK